MPHSWYLTSLLARCLQALIAVKASAFLFPFFLVFAGRKRARDDSVESQLFSSIAGASMKTPKSSPILENVPPSNGRVSSLRVPSASPTEGKTQSSGPFGRNSQSSSLFGAGSSSSRQTDQNGLNSGPSSSRPLDQNGLKSATHSSEQNGNHLFQSKKEASREPKTILTGNLKDSEQKTDIRSSDENATNGTPAFSFQKQVFGGQTSSPVFGSKPSSNPFRPKRPFSEVSRNNLFDT